MKTIFIFKPIIHIIYLLASIFYLIYCTPDLKTEKICDTNDPVFIRNIYLLRATTNEEFYCNLRIKERNSTNNNPTPNNPLAPTISFSKTLYFGFQGEEYNILPTLGGGAVTSCSSTPTLPSGLSINPTTCAITGTASTGGAGASYTITATNSGGSVTASTKIKVLGPNAFRVYGQNGDFNSGATNLGSLATNGANCMSNPAGAILDSNDNLYVGDRNNHRVLFFPNGSTTATRVYGQGNSFTTNALGSGSATVLNLPTRVAVDLQNNAYVADENNHRVLRFSSDGNTTANFVFGQNGVLTNNLTGGTNINRFNFPYWVSFDPDGNMYIADANNNRVLFYPSGTTTPNFVYGQVNFTSATSALTASGLSEGTAVIADKDKVYISDTFSSNRILIFPKGNPTADIVLGQSDFITGTLGTCNASSIKTASGIIGLSLDPNGNLFVTSFGANRVLIFKPPFTTNMNATYVLGQTNLTNFSNCTFALGNNRLRNPLGNVGFDSFGNAYIADALNNRVLVF